MGVRYADGLWPLMVPIDSIRQHPDNYNNGDVDAIIESITVNGFMSPLIVQKSTGYIVAGNHRWQALHAMGATEVPAVMADLSDDRAKRYLLADNRTAKLAVTDDAAMFALLRELSESEDGLIGTGFDQNAYEQLLLDLANPEPIGEGEGFGIAVAGIYQVVVDFDNEEDRDTLLSELDMAYGEKVRKVNL